MGTLTVRIAIESDPMLLHIVRSVVKKRASEAGFSEADADSLALAVDEAATNVIRHTYGNRCDCKLELEITTYPDRLEFVLEDFGPCVKPENIRPRSLDEVRPGGLGTLIIQSYMDSTCYDTGRSHGNRLKMVKYLPGKGSRRDETANPKRQ
jgi:anti-sigma regulatory factor (Ser/Thr protein kinase)